MPELIAFGPRDPISGKYEYTLSAVYHRIIYWEKTLRTAMNKGYITPAGLTYIDNVSPSSTVEHTLTVPAGYICICPYYEVWTDNVGWARYTLKVNTLTVEAPTEWRNFTVALDRPILPPHKKVYTLFSKYDVYLKWENLSPKKTSRCIFFAPFWQMTGTHAYNLYVKIYKLLEDQMTEAIAGRPI